MKRKKFETPQFCDIYETHSEDLVESRISYSDLLSYAKDLMHEYNMVVAYAQELEDRIEELTDE